MAERQVNEMNSAQANTPATPSNLINPPVEVDSPGTVAGGQPADDENKR